jgi:hypothetical protein
MLLRLSAHPVVKIRSAGHASNMPALIERQSGEKRPTEVDAYKGFHLALPSAFQQIRTGPADPVKERRALCLLVGGGLPTAAMAGRGDAGNQGPCTAIG